MAVPFFISCYCLRKCRFSYANLEKCCYSTVESSRVESSVVYCCCLLKRRRPSTKGWDESFLPTHMKGHMNFLDFKRLRNDEGRGCKRLESASLLLLLTASLCNLIKSHMRTTRTAANNPRHLFQKIPKSYQLSADDWLTVVFCPLAYPDDIRRRQLEYFEGSPFLSRFSKFHLFINKKKNIRKNEFWDE